MVSGWMVDRVLHRVGLCKTLIPGSNPGVASIGKPRKRWYVNSFSVSYMFLCQKQECSIFNIFWSWKIKKWFYMWQNVKNLTKNFIYKCNKYYKKHWQATENNVLYYKYVL